MKYFKLANPNKKMQDEKVWEGIDSDPTISLRYEEYLFVKAPTPQFEQVWNLYTETMNRNEKLGCASLFYFTYYTELRNRIEEITGDEKQLLINIRVLKMFVKESLINWLEFIKRSDDTLYPQNIVFKEIAAILKPLFPKHLEQIGRIKNGYTIDYSDRFINEYGSANPHIYVYHYDFINNTLRRAYVEIFPFHWKKII